MNLKPAQTGFCENVRYSQAKQFMLFKPCFFRMYIYFEHLYSTFVLLIFSNMQTFLILAMYKLSIREFSLGFAEVKYQQQLKHAECLVNTCSK